MSFALLGLGLAFALYLLGSSLLSLVVGLGFSAFERAALCLHPRWRASVLFGLGLLPALGGTVLALGLVLPAWLTHEPREGDERAGPVLLFLATLGALLVFLRLGTALRDQLRTAQTVRDWIAAGQPLPGLPLVAIRFPHDFPVAALCGFVRPRLLLAEGLLHALSAPELEAVVAHELAHLEARDNWKRLLLRAAPAPLAFCAKGTTLLRAFEEAAEAAADRRATDRVPPLCLAQALLKVAALVPPGQRLEMSAAALHHDGSLAARVRALLLAHDHEAPAGVIGRGSLRGASLLALAALVLLVVGSSALPAVHLVLEGLVHLLS